MTNSEQHEYLCSILSKLVPCDEITGEELKDLAAAAGITVSEFYGDDDQELMSPHNRCCDKEILADIGEMISKERREEALISQLEKAA